MGCGGRRRRCGRRRFGRRGAGGSAAALRVLQLRSPGGRVAARTCARPNRVIPRWRALSVIRRRRSMATSASRLALSSSPAAASRMSSRTGATSGTTSASSSPRPWTSGYGSGRARPQRGCTGAGPAPSSARARARMSRVPGPGCAEQRAPAPDGHRTGTPGRSSRACPFRVADHVSAPAATGPRARHDRQSGTPDRVTPGYPFPLADHRLRAAGGRVKPMRCGYSRVRQD